MYDNIKQSFINPSNEFSAMPFWFWNDDLQEKEIEKQIYDFNAKGVNGFIIHPRIGIPKKIEYLSDRFMGLVKFAVETAASLSMQVILYDEGMYPSGSAHGMVVQNNPDFASKGLKMIECSVAEFEKYNHGNIITVLAAHKISGNMIDAQSVMPYEQGKEIGDRKLFVFILEFTGGHIRGIHFGEDDCEDNAPPSADLLNPKAVRKFIQLTHEHYYEILSEYFGKTIIAMFTDEPAIMGRGPQENMIPWTDDFIEDYIKSGGRECDLPALWLNMGDETFKIRKRYTSAIQKRMEESYYKPIYDWCAKHQIALTGHPGASNDIGLLKYFQIPGQDLIFRMVGPEDELSLLGVDSTLAKCSSDAARHYGRRRNLNECFACSGKNNLEWSFSADDMKWMLDWLFVRGVNMISPHAFFYSIDGERRIGERPPDVGPNNIWWEHYNQISTYIKRMCYMLIDGVNTAKTAILCEADYLPYEIAKPLFTHQIEFNYLEEELLLTKCNIESGKIRIEKQCYSYLVIENKKLLTAEMNSKLHLFVQGGGTVIVLNQSDVASGYIDIRNVNDIPYFLPRTVTIQPQDKNLRVSCIIKNGIRFYILVNEGENEINGRLSIDCDEKVEAWHPWNGEIANIDLNNFTLPRRESIILCASHQEKEISINQWFVNDKSISLSSWTKWDDYEFFSGSMVYRTQITIEACEQAILDLGDVYEIAEVTLNGVSVGVKMWAPYVFNVTDFVKIGDNHLEVKVTNSLANKLHHVNLPSGLCGEVKFKILKIL